MRFMSNGVESSVGGEGCARPWWQGVLMAVAESETRVSVEERGGGFGEGIEAES